MPGSIFDDEDFKALSPEGQRQILAEKVPDFAALSPHGQRKFLIEKTGRAPAPDLGILGEMAGTVPAMLASPEGRAQYRGNLKAGAIEGAAGLPLLGANALMLAKKAVENLPPVSGVPGAVEALTKRLDLPIGVEEYLRAGAEGMLRDAEPMRGQDTFGKSLEVLGGTATGLPTAMAAAELAGPVAGFAGLGALGAAHLGPKEALKEGVKGGALGLVFKGTARASRPVRAITVGGATYALSNERDPVKRAMEAATMATLAAIPDRAPRPAEVSRQLDEIAQGAIPTGKVEPVKGTAPPKTAPPLAPAPEPPKAGAPAKSPIEDWIDTHQPVQGPAQQTTLPDGRTATQLPDGSLELGAPPPVVPPPRPLTPQEQAGLETGTPIAPPQPKPGGSVYGPNEPAPTMLAEPVPPVRAPEPVAAEPPLVLAPEAAKPKWDSTAALPPGVKPPGPDRIVTIELPDGTKKYEAIQSGFPEEPQLAEIQGRFPDAKITVEKPRTPAEQKAIDRGQKSKAKPRVGKGAEIRVEGRPEPLSAKYELVEADTLVPSHDSITFGKRADYKGGQERAYESDKNEQMKVVQRADQFDVREVLSTAPNATTGPAIVGPDGTVWGGNGRTMMQERIWRGQAKVKPEELKAAIAEAAPQFGFTKTQVLGMKRPAIIRRIPDSPTTREAALELSRILNIDPSFKTSGTARAQSLAVSMDKSIDAFISAVEGAAKDDPSIRAAIKDGPRGKAFAEALIEDGVIPPAERAEWIDADGTLTDVGLARAEKILLARVIPDRALVENMPGALRQKILRSLPQILQIEGMKRGSFAPLIADVVKSEVRRAGERDSTGKILTIEEFNKQTSMDPVPSQVSERVARVQKMFAENSALAMKEKIAELRERVARSIEPDMFGGTMPLEEAFGGIGFPEQAEQLARESGVHYRRGRNFTGDRKLDVGKATDTAKPVKLRGEPMEKLARAFKIPMVQGRLRGLKGKQPSESVAGYYSHPSGTLRVRKWADLDTAAHEFGHRLMQANPKVFDWFLGPPGAPRRAAHTQMQEMAYTTKNPHEWFAEFMRYWLTNRAELERHAPDALREWEAEGPKLVSRAEWRALKRAQREMSAFYEQGAESGMEALFEKQNEAGSVLSDRRARWRQANVDRFHGLFMLEREVLGKPDAGLPGGVWAHARMLTRVPNLVEKLWTHGYPVWEKSPTTGSWEIGLRGKGMREILAPVAKTKRMERQFEKYAVARMMKVAREHGIKKLPLTPEMEAQGLAFETPAFRKAYEELAVFREKVADFAQAAGLFNATQRARWRFGGEMVWSLSRDMGAASRGRAIEDPVSASSGVHAMRGSTRTLRDPMDSIIAGPGRLIQLALENLVKREAARLVERPEGGRMGQILKPEGKTARLLTDAIESAVQAEAEKVGLQLPKNWTEDHGFADFLSVYAGTKKPYGENVVSHLENGRPVHVEYFDPVLMKSITSLRRPASDVVQNILFNAPRRFYQRAVTSNPNFWIAQLLRDPIAATWVTKTGMQAITSSVRGYAESLRNGDALALYEANLGGMGSQRPRSPGARRADLLRAGRREAGGARAMLDLMNPVNALRFFERIGEHLEAGPRVGEFMRAREQGRALDEAAFMGNEVTGDFSSQGGGAATTWMVNSIPFYRAMIASADLGYRSLARGDGYSRARNAARFATFVGLHAAYHLWAREQDWYKKLAPWDRLMNFVFPPIEIDGVVYHPTMPKTYEVGMAGNVAERVIEKAFDPEDTSEWVFTKDIAKAILANFGIGLPVIPNALLEQYANRTTFFDTPIEGQDQVKSEGWYKRAPQTPLVLSDLAALQKGLPLDAQVSAPRMHAALRSFLGPWAQYGLFVADEAMYGGQHPELHFDDFPAVSRILQREGKYTRTAGDFYDFIGAAHAAAQVHRDAKERADLETRTEYQDKPERRVAKRAGKWERHVGELNNRIEKIARDPLLSPAKKTELIDELKRQREAYMSEKLEQGRAYMRAVGGGR